MDHGSGESGPEQTAFDSVAFLQFKQTLTTATEQTAALGIDNARHLAELLDQNVSLCQQAWKIEAHTDDMVELIRSLAGMHEGSTSRDLYQAIPDFIQSVFPVAAHRVADGPERMFERTLGLANELIDGHNSRFQRAGVDYFLPLVDRITDTDRLTDQRANEIMSHLFTYATPEQLAPIYHDVIDPTSHLSSSRRFGRGIYATSLLGLGLLGEAASGDRREKMMLLLNEMTNGQGDAFITAWDMSVEQEPTGAMSSVYLSNFGAMCALERSATQAEREGRPGICLLLFSEYTLRCFGRYTTEQLVDQYMDHGRRDIPYGVVLASSISNDIEMYDLDLTDNRAIYQQAKTLGRSVRVYEASGDAELFRAINHSAAEHGPISFMVLNGHSLHTAEGDGVALGKIGNEYIGLTIAMLRTGYVDLAALRAAFTADAFVLFLHCGVGVRNGLCQYLSTQIADLPISGADFMYAPSISALTLRETLDGGIEIDADFNFATGLRDRVPQDFASIVQHTYRNGLEIGEGKSG